MAYDNERVERIVAKIQGPKKQREKKILADDEKFKGRNKGATGPGKGQLNDASVSTPGTVDRKGNAAFNAGAYKPTQKAAGRPDSMKAKLIPPASVRQNKSRAH